MAFAVVADIHGNRWALEAVLAELDRLAIREVVDLGDCLYGPLDPGGTLELLRSRAWPTVRGNMDRILLEPPPSPPPRDHGFVAGEIGEAGIEWIRRRTRPPFAAYGAFHCHGDPGRDDRYLVEVVSGNQVRLRVPRDLDEALDGVAEFLVTCGHSHVPRLVASTRGVTIVNPGSVGLPAYEHDTPSLHVMASGSPHARFALVEPHRRGWQVEHRSVPYDHSSAARAAERHGRPDWRDWLLSGRV